MSNCIHLSWVYIRNWTAGSSGRHTLRILSILVGVYWYLTGVLIWISLRRMILNTFSYAYQSFRSPLFVDVSSSCLFTFLLLTFKSGCFPPTQWCDSSLILWIWVQCQDSDCEYHLPVCVLPFNSLNVNVWWTEILYKLDFNKIIFSYIISDYCICFFKKNNFCLSHFLFP